ncbi:Spy/CpxP family protein refolding chaperone, partial [Shewanella indica]|uniref:Spy/CpxP family protein refolding chaperone n=1 Tax=Shewanella indica TaxID=768528 RepID=UPI001C04DAE6
MKTSIKASLLALIAGTTLMAGAVQAGDGYGDCPHRDGDRGYHHMKGERGYHHMKGDKGHFGMYGLRGLDLTDAQKTEIQALMEQHRSSMSRPDKETRAAHRAEMQALMTSGNFDEAKAKKIIEQRQQVREQHMLERMKLH